MMFFNKLDITIFKLLYLIIEIIVVEIKIYLNSNQAFAFRPYLLCKLGR